MDGLWAYLKLQNVYTHIGYDHAKEELSKMPNMEKELNFIGIGKCRKVVNM